MKTKLILSFAALSSLPSTAADRTWDGGDATANMTAAANWNGNAVINPAVDRLVFPYGLPVADRTVTNNYAANTLFYDLLFYDSYTLGGTLMKLESSLECLHDAGTTVTVNAGISLQGLSALYTSQGNLVFGAGSQIYLNGNTVNFAALFPTASATVGGVLAGGGQINVTGDGTVRFAGAKTFTAPVSIGSGGTLIADNDGSLGGGAGLTDIAGGTLVLDSVAALSIPESILMNNADPQNSYIVSKGGAHTLSGPIEFAGDHFKRFEVEGTSLTLSGAISGPVSTGSMRKTGPGRLTISGAASNTVGIQSFSAYSGEVRLNKSGGATAVSSPFVLIGNNAAPADSAIVRLGASNQIADTTQVNISSDGWFDLAGRQETIRSLWFNGEGRVTTNGGTLRIEEDVRAFSAAQNGGEAVIDGALTLAAANSEWLVEGGAGGIDLTVNGSVTSLVPDSTLYKTGAGTLRTNGTLDVAHLRVDEGGAIVSGDNPGAEVTVTEGGRYYGTGTSGDLTCTAAGSVDIGTPGNQGTLASGNVSISGPWGGLVLSYLTAAPGAHDQLNVTGSVTLSNTGVLLVGPMVQVTSPGDEILFINNDGADPIAGTFNSLPEGHITASGYYVSYKGGDGNDFTLTHIVPPTGVTRLWDGGSAVDSNWMTAANWNPNGTPQPGDDLVFPTSAARKANTNNFPAGTTFHSITVHGTGYTLGGNSITLNEKVEFTSASGSHFLSLPITLALDATISITGNGFVQADEPINLNGHKLTLHNAGGGTGDLFISGDLTGTGRVWKTGPGRITFFEQPNSYAGPTSIQEGTLAVKADATLGAAGNGNGTTVHAGATLLLRNNEGDVVCPEAITLHGTIADNGGTFACDLTGPLDVPVAGTITAVGNMMEHSKTISGAGVLTKNGLGRLRIRDESTNTLSGSFRADAGITEVAMQTAWDHAFLCPVIVGGAGQPATVKLGLDVLGDQIPVTIHPTGVLDLNYEIIGSLVLHGGGSVLSTSPGGGLLELSTGNVTVLANAATAVISARLGTVLPATGRFIVSDGAAATDLRVDSAVFGTRFDKTGAGRVDFMAEIPLAGLDLLDLQQGSALFFHNSRYTAIHMNGGLLGGNGTVGNISSIAGGTVSPGASPGALGGNIATWNAATTLRMELNGLNPGADYDQYFVNSELNLGGAALALSAGFDPAPGTEFMIVRNVGGSPINGTFAGLPQNGYVSAPGAKIFQINYTGGDGDDVVLTRVEVDAPEIVEHSMAPGVDEEKGYNDTDLTVLGAPGLTYQLETSTDLVAWTVQQSVKADIETGLMQFEFLNPETDPRIFLRVSLP